MKLSKSFELGLAIMLIIAKRPDDSAIAAKAIASQLGASLTYSQKLLRKLVIAGLIRAVPGSGGGFTLARPATQISLADIVSAIEGRAASYHQTNQINLAINSGQVSNSIARTFETADLVWQQVLSQATLAEILADHN